MILRQILKLPDSPNVVSGCQKVQFNITGGMVLGSVLQQSYPSTQVLYDTSISVCNVAAIMVLGGGTVS